MTKTKLYAGNAESGIVGMHAPTDTNLYAFYAGATSTSSFADAPFRVTKKGKLYANEAIISGKMSAISGSNRVILSNGKVSFGYGSSAGAYIKGWSDSNSMMISASSLQLSINSLSLEVGGVGYIPYSGTKNGITFKNGICVT